MSDVNTAPRKNKINIVPSDKKLNNIMENKKLSPSMRREFCDLHHTNNDLKNFLEKEMEVVDKVVREFIIAGNSFDFSWTEYTLRDAIIKEFDDFFAFSQNLKMLGLDDEESIEALKDVLRISDSGHKFMTVLMYYGAPADNDNILSGVRFIDVVGVSDDDDTYSRSSFLRYSRNII